MDSLSCPLPPAPEGDRERSERGGVGFIPTANRPQIRSQIIKNQEQSMVFMEGFRLFLIGLNAHLIGKLLLLRFGELNLAEIAAALLYFYRSFPRDLQELQFFMMALIGDLSANPSFLQIDTIRDS